MPTFKTTLVFEDTIFKTGNSEVYFSNVADHNLALALAEGLIDSRMPLATNGYFCRYCRVSNWDHARDSILKFWGDTKVGTAGTSPIEFDQALLVTLYNAPDAKGRKFLHSMSRSQFTGRVFTPDGGTVLNLVTYRDTLKGLIPPVIGSPFGFLKKTAPNTYAFKGTADLFPQNMTRHKVGRPFDPLRGRARTAA